MPRTTLGTRLWTFPQCNCWTPADCNPIGQLECLDLPSNLSLKAWRVASNRILLTKGKFSYLLWLCRYQNLTDPRSYCLIDLLSTEKPSAIGNIEKFVANHILIPPTQHCIVVNLYYLYSMSQRIAFSHFELIRLVRVLSNPHALLYVFPAIIWKCEILDIGLHSYEDLPQVSAQARCNTDRQSMSADLL